MERQNPPPCLVLGGGGHARVLLDSLLSSGTGRPVAVLDEDRSLWGKELMGVPVKGGDDLIPEFLKQGIRYFVVGLGSVGDNRPRIALFDRAIAHGLTPLTVRHPSAICSRWATVGAGSVLFPGALVNAGAVIGRNVIVNTGAIVEHECVIGDHAHISTGARLASTVKIGRAAHIGIGSTIRQCLSVGEGAIVGAGAVVIKDVKPWTVMVGVPAEPLRVTGTVAR